MSQRAVTTVLLLVAFGALLSSCSNNSPTAPSNNSHTSASTASVGRLLVTMGVSDAGQDPLGAWRYNATFLLREEGGVDVTVTNINAQVLLGSKVLATASITPMLSVLAHSSADTTFVFTSDSHVQVSTMAANVTVEFFDANGNTGSFSGSYCCFGSYDY